MTLSELLKHVDEARADKEQLIKFLESQRSVARDYLCMYPPEEQKGNDTYQFYKGYESATDAALLRVRAFLESQASRPVLGL